MGSEIKSTMDVLLWIIGGIVTLCAGIVVLDKLLWVFCTPKQPRDKRIVPAWRTPVFEEQTRRWTPYQKRKVAEDKAVWMDSFSA